MRKSYKILIAGLLCLSVSYSFAAYTLKSSIPVPNNEGTGCVVVKIDGTAYVGTFSATTSNILKFTNALDSTAYTVSTVTTISMASGRGLDDADVDAGGNVYIHGTGAGDADSPIVKINSSDQVQWVVSPSRSNGVAVLGDKLAITKTWTDIWFLNTSDGSTTGITVPGSIIYNRQIVFNSFNNEIYVANNGNYNEYSGKIFSGGSPTNLSGYSQVTQDLFYGSFSTQYGGANQPIASVSTYFARWNNVTKQIDVYTISGTGASTIFTANGNISVYGGCNGLYFFVKEGVVYLAVNAAYGTDTFSYALDIWDISTPVSDWRLY